MYEYKVLVLGVKKCEEQFNQLAKDGWRLVTMCPNQTRGVGVIATLEREVQEDPAASREEGAAGRVNFE